jgi:FkbM family methyltransferase
MSNESKMVIPFFRDMESFFYGKALTYVDVGAFKGHVLRQLAGTTMSVREAHLIEPNPDSFAEMAEASRQIASVKYVRVHNVAISSEARRLRMHAEGGMTKVIETAVSGSRGVASGNFEVESTTLDALARECGIERISILKIDVEGHECEVLEGARGLLSDQKIDVIYVEAGFDPQSKQQTYYRRIEDALGIHGYRVFRIYEQTNEWPDDSPFLRRVNIAFMSSSFAASSPYRVISELLDIKRASASKASQTGLTAVVRAATSPGEKPDELLAGINALKSRIKKGIAEVSAQIADLKRTGPSSEEEHASQLSEIIAGLHELQARSDAISLQLESALGDQAKRMTSESSRFDKLDEAYRSLMSALSEERQARAEDSEQMSRKLRSIAAQTKSVSRHMEAARKRAERDASAQKKLNVLLEYTDQLERGYHALLGSTSWRMTSPLRAIVSRLRRLLKGGAVGREWLPVRPDLDVVAVGSVDSNKDDARRSTTRHQVRAMRRRMLDLGFVEAGLERLEEWAQDGKNRLRKQLAGSELALFHLNEGGEQGVARALELLPSLISSQDGADGRRRLSILHSEAMHRSGDPDMARKIIERELERNGSHPDLFLALANLGEDIAERVRWINKALDYCGLERVSLAAGDKEPYDRLQVEVPVAPMSNADSLVTVIVPAYNSERTIITALRCLAEQTYRNIQVLIVDDCSTDDTVSVAAGFIAGDPRFQLIRAHENAGPYVARNLALREARGEFVTCHDADDWSHPRKIELQVAQMLSNPALVANQGAQARATSELQFSRRGNFGAYCFANLSSLMFRRIPVFEKLGFWDSVRFMADGEMLRRIELTFGAEATSVIESALTSFQRKSDSSLTEHGEFGYHGYMMGARKEYFDASMQYHTSGAELRYDFPQLVRPFVVPAPMLPDRGGTGSKHFDVIIVSDFRLAGGSTLSSIEEAKAQYGAGLRTGLVQMSRFDMDPTQRRVSRKVRELVNSGRAEFIVFGETVSCDLLIVRYPPVLDYYQRYVAAVQAKHVRVIVNQPPMSDYGPNAVRRYRIPECQKNLLRTFGVSGPWHPIGPAVRDALHEHHADDLRAIDLSPENWENIVDIAQYARHERPRFTGSRRPRIGRHARDHEVKWPGDRDTLLSVYPDKENYEVYVMGGAEIPKRMLGGLPENWTVVEFDGLSVREYLEGLDVFLYFTHKDWVESFGRVVIEAMAAGVPVILPHSYEALFEDSALYCEPHEALALVDRLMADPEFYSSRVRIAHEFVDRRFGYAMHIARIGRFLSPRGSGIEVARS